MSQPGWQPPAPHEPGQRDPRAKRRLILWVCVVAVLAALVTAAIIVINVMNDARDPAAQVEEYLDYLAAGKAEAASKLVDPGLKEGEDALLTDEVLGAATERIEVRSVETLSRDGDRAQVRAKLSLGGERFEYTFAVERGPKDFLVLDTWKLEDPLIVDLTLGYTIEKTPGMASQGDDLPTSTFAIGSTPVELRDASDEFITYRSEVAVYPAIYETKLDFGEYFEPLHEQVTASPDDDTNVTTTISPSELKATKAFETAIMALAQPYAAGCVAIGSNTVVSGNMDRDCPGIVQSTQLAALRVAQQAKGFQFLDFDMFATEKFTFEVTGNSAGAKPQTSEDRLYGRIEWRDGEPLIIEAYFSY